MRYAGQNCFHPSGIVTVVLLHRTSGLHLSGGVLSAGHFWLLPAYHLEISGVQAQMFSDSLSQDIFHEAEGRETGQQEYE